MSSFTGLGGIMRKLALIAIVSCAGCVLRGPTSQETANYEREYANWVAMGSQPDLKPERLPRSTLSFGDQRPPTQEPRGVFNNPMPVRVPWTHRLLEDEDAAEDENK